MGRSGGTGQWILVQKTPQRQYEIDEMSPKVSERMDVLIRFQQEREYKKCTIWCRSTNGVILRISYIKSPYIKVITIRIKCIKAMWNAKKAGLARLDFKWSSTGMPRISGGKSTLLPVKTWSRWPSFRCPSASLPNTSSFRQFWWPQLSRARGKPQGQRKPLAQRPPESSPKPSLCGWGVAIGVLRRLGRSDPRQVGYFYGVPGVQNRILGAPPPLGFLRSNIPIDMGKKCLSSGSSSKVARCDFRGFSQ